MRGFAEYEAYDGLGLAQLVRDGEVSAREVVEAAIARIESRDPALNAVVQRTFDAALAAADEHRDGPFAGVPILVKDLMTAVKGLPLTSSSRFMADYVPDHDAELIRRLRAAGFVLAGKTNTPEFGIMGVTESRFRGPARNPWNTDHTPGGSSGGSGAAVAARMVPIAHGGDGGGSIRIPASCCGVFGLKPTRGRNPMGPDFGESWAGLVQEHALTLTVRDSAALLDATAGPDLGAPYFAPPPERPFLEEVGAEPGRLRIAFTEESLFGETTDPACRAAVQETADLCASLGHEVIDARPDFDKQSLRRSYLAIVAVGTARAIDDAATVTGRTPEPSLFEPPTWLLGMIGRKMSAAEYLAALDAMQRATRKIASLFTTVDVLLTPTMAHPPARIGAFDLSMGDRLTIRTLRAMPAKALLDKALETMAAEIFEATANTMLFNQTGQPAMSVPLFWSDAGLPIGSQFVARYAEEATLFRLAAQLEAARPWRERVPPLAAATP